MPGENIRILVIDDDADLIESISATLRAQGYEVLTATSGEKGLELAYTRHPHVVLLDVMMPGMDGYQVCRELQFGYTKDIPIVFLTARTELANMVEANRSGASAYITKPFRTDRLVETIRNVLRDTSVYRDEITGLPTLQSVQIEVQRMLLDHGQLGIIYVSLEGMHALEQLQGFEVVDDVFRLVSRRLQDARGELIRGEDFISISSLGDAFLVVLSPAREHRTIDQRDLLAIKERLESQLLERLEDELESRLLAKIDLFVGCARLTRSPKVRFKRALLEAINEATREIEQDRGQVQDRLREEFERVIAGEQVSCVFQPIVGLENYSVIGYELLARGPVESELHRPDALFEVARDEDRVSDLDRLCRLTAARGSASLPTRYLRFINTEPMSMFLNPRDDLFVQEFVEATAPELRELTVIELTENSVIDDFDQMRSVVTRLRSHGFRIAVDDAGAGYSGLQTMVEIEPDFIKLDRSLISKLDESIVKQKLVRTLRDFCDDAGITLIAEGIETQEQLETLHALGVTHGQGFLFGQPGSPYPLRETCPPCEPVAVVATGD